MEDSLSSVQLRSASSTASSPGAEATVATVAIAQRVGADYSSKAGEIRVIDAFVEAVGGEVWTPIMMRERERGFSLFNIDLSSLDTEEEETDELDFRDLSRRIEDCSSRGMFAECSTLLDECIERSSRLQGSLNKETLSFMHRKAQCLHDAEKYDEAQSIYEVCLSKRQATLGDLHLDTLITMNGLANNLRCLGKYDVAGEIFSNCLEKMRASLALLCGERRAETTDSTTSFDREEERNFRLLILEVANNLANVYTHIGEYDKAEDLFEDVLRTQKVMLGESHLFTINSLHNLSILYRKRGVLRKELACLTSLLSHKRRLFESGQCGAREMVDLMRLLAGCHASLGELERAKHVLEVGLPAIIR
jgi:tetratricopeptide (TPR) repeat protein